MRVKESFVKAGKSLFNSLPVLFGIILLISLTSVLIPKKVYTSIFTGNLFFDPFIGSLVGSVLAGNPITSYIIGGELLNQGISLITITAFIVSWVTVGIVQLPAEAFMLGKKFALLRNFISFILSILVAITTYFLVNLI